MNYKDCFPNPIFPPFSAILILFAEEETLKQACSSKISKAFETGKVPHLVQLDILIEEFDPQYRELGIFMVAETR